MAVYGGDGTQHEVTSAILSSPRQVPLVILPGGTGNGFCRENGVPDDLVAAVELMCTSANLRHVDAVKLGDGFFIQRLYTGVEPEQQTSREMKDRYGVLAYPMTVRQQVKETIEADYRTVTFSCLHHGLPRIEGFHGGRRRAAVHRALRNPCHPVIRQICNPELPPVCITDCHGLKDDTEAEGAQPLRNPCHPVIRLLRDSDLLLTVVGGAL